MTTAGYVYRLKKMGASSEKFGVCEVCQKHVSDVHYQVEGRGYTDAGGMMAITHHGCRNLWGCRGCLMASQRILAEAEHECAPQGAQLGGEHE
jgi:hypothetical protein